MNQHNPDRGILLVSFSVLLFASLGAAPVKPKLPSFDDVRKTAIKYFDEQPNFSADQIISQSQVQGLFEKLSPLQINGNSKPEVAVSAAEFLLEGMYAHKRISRSEERSFSAAEKKQRNDPSQYVERSRDNERDESAKTRTRRGFN